MGHRPRCRWLLTQRGVTASLVRPAIEQMESVLTDLLEFSILLDILAQVRFQTDSWSRCSTSHGPATEQRPCYAYTCCGLVNKHWIHGEIESSNTSSAFLRMLTHWEWMLVHRGICLKSLTTTEGNCAWKIFNSISTSKPAGTHLRTCKSAWKPHRRWALPMVISSDRKASTDWSWGHAFGSMYIHTLGGQKTSRCTLARC